MHRNLHTSWFGAGPQQVNDIQMVSYVVEYLQLSHQSFVLAGCGSLWWIKCRKEKQVNKCTCTELYDDFLS